jgi:hypothetical protein
MHNNIVYNKGYKGDIHMEFDLLNMIEALASHQQITENRMYSYLQTMRDLKETNPALYGTISTIVNGAYRLGMSETK